MLVGRTAELARLGELLDGARQRRSSAMVVHGEAGIGKSALLAEVRAQAVGFVTLNAQGMESEAQLAFTDAVLP